MKAEIHPTYYPQATVSCSCGATFTVGATKEKMQVEICSSCHPFFSGQEKIIDTAGRVEKFKQRRSKVAPVKVKVPRPKKAKPSTKLA